MAKATAQTPKAAADKIAVEDYLGQFSRTAPKRFETALRKAYELIGDHPEIGSPRYAQDFPQLPEVLRFVLVRGFPRVMVFYLNTPSLVLVIRVWDCSRDLASLLDY